jgi:hypothetical protein
MINTEYSGPDSGDPDIRFRTATLSLSLPYAILIWAASSILFDIVRWNMTEGYRAGLTFCLLSVSLIFAKQRTYLKIHLFLHTFYDIIIQYIIFM